MHINSERMDESIEEREYSKIWLRFSLYKEIEEHEKSLPQEEIVDVLKGILNSYTKDEE